MIAEEFRKTIAACGMSQAGVSRFLGISKISDYATGQSRVLDLIEIVFALVRYFNVSPADVRRIAGLPPENYSDRRRNRVHMTQAEIHRRSDQAGTRRASQLSA